MDVKLGVTSRKSRNRVFNFQNSEGKTQNEKKVLSKRRGNKEKHKKRQAK